MRISTLLFTLLISCVMSAQSDPAAYQLFNEAGRRTKFKKLVKDAKKADVVLFGETHNDPVAHWLQNHLARELQADRPIVIGMEMFESDQQAVLNDYLAGKATTEDINGVGEGLWGNFKTDYQPLVDWAKGESIAVVATNTPRKYARLVFKQGFESLNELTEAEKKLLPPLPVPYDASLPGYVRMLEMMPGGHSGSTFPMAQAIKDATMAHFIVQNIKPNTTFLHLNGSYHSDDYEGIGWYLKQYAPELKVVTISFVEAEDAASGKADFVFVTDSLMGKSY